MKVVDVLPFLSKGKPFYAHSAGEGYHYLGKIVGGEIVGTERGHLSEALEVNLTEIQTLELDSVPPIEACFQPVLFTNPRRPYPQFNYLAQLDSVWIDTYPAGFRISFGSAGVLYVSR